MNLKQIDWLKRVVLPLGLATMQLCWLYPWAVLLGLWLQPVAGPPLLSAPSIFIMLVLSRSAARWAWAQNWPVARARTGLLAFGLVACVFAVRVDHYSQVDALDPSWLGQLFTAFSNVLASPSAPVFGLALGLYVWWRGIVQARGEITAYEMQRAFGIGVMALGAFLLIALAGGSLTYQSMDQRLGIYVVVYLFAGLVSLSLARLNEIHSESRERSGSSPAFNGHWLAVMLAVVTLLLLFTAALAQLLSFDLITAVAGPIIYVVQSVAWFVLFAIAYVLGYVAAALVFLLRLITHPGEPQSLPQPPSATTWDQMQRDAIARGLPPEVLFAAKWGLLALVVFAVLFAILRSIFRWHDRVSDDDVPEERDSVWAGGSLWSMFLAWLASLAGRFSTRRALPGPMSAASAAGASEPPAIASIRQAYRHLLRLGAALGIPRPASDTPYEHLQRLQSVLDPSEDVAAITEVYVDVRYGQDPPSDEQVRTALTRLKRVEQSTREHN